MLCEPGSMFKTVWGIRWWIDSAVVAEFGNKSRSLTLKAVSKHPCAGGVHLDSFVFAECSETNVCGPRY